MAEDEPKSAATGALAVAAVARENQRRLKLAEEERERQSLVELMSSVKSLASTASGIPPDELERLAAEFPPLEAMQERREPSEQEKRRRRAKDAGAPEKHIRHVVDAEPEDCESLATVKAFLIEPKEQLLALSGGVGTRKTGAAVWLFSQVEGRFVGACDLLRLAIHEREQFEALKAAPLVVVDDIGSERLDEKGYFAGAFAELVDALYSAESRLVVTGNLNPEQFRSRYGDRVYDRWREVGRFVVIGGSSLRRRA